MEFNVRAISLADGVPRDARIDPASLLGKEVQFRAGLPFSIKLPDDAAKFALIPDPEKLLTALDGWARVYVHPDGDGRKVHVLAPSETEDSDVVFYRLDFTEVRHVKGPRPPVDAIGGAILTYEECATWLMELSAGWRADPDRKNLQFVRSRPCGIKPNKIRLAWVIPEVVEERSVKERLLAIGDAHGVDIVHVIPRDYKDTKARLAKALPYDGAVICRHFAAAINADAVPVSVPREMIHFCDSTTLPDLESQIRVWVEIVAEQMESRRQYAQIDEEKFLLELMVRAMLSHAKIGEFKHCSRETVLTVIRGRRLNVPEAERILDKNCEQYGDTKTSTALFLWKDHNDGRQYFLNPKRVGELKPTVAPS
jgi:hypothetical protein